MSKDISKLQDQVTKRLFGKTDWSKRGLSGPAVLYGVTLDGRLGEESALWWWGEGQPA